MADSGIPAMVGKALEVAERMARREDHRSEQIRCKALGIVDRGLALLERQPDEDEDGDDE